MITVIGARVAEGQQCDNGWRCFLLHFITILYCSYLHSQQCGP